MSPLFQRIYNLVVTNTNRPNLMRETVEAIKTATLEFHQRGRFINDVRVALLTSTNGGQLDYVFRIPHEKRVRRILAVQPIRSDGKVGKKLPQLGIFDVASCGKIGYSWTADTLKITLPHAATTFQMSYLEFPNLAENEYDSWIARVYPHFIAAAATVKVLVAAGMADQAGYYNSLVGEAARPGSYVWTLLNQNAEVDNYADA